MSDIRRPSPSHPTYLTEPSAFINMLSDDEKDTICQYYLDGNSLESTRFLIFQELYIDVVAKPLIKLLKSRGIAIRKVYKLRKRCSASEVEHHVLAFWKSSGGCTLKEMQQYLLGLIGKTPAEATISRILETYGLRNPKKQQK